MSNDNGGYNAEEFRSSVFIKKDSLKRDGPQRLTIKAVEKGDGIARNGRPAKPVLQLTFENDTKFSLIADVNLKRVIEQYGPQTSGWMNQAIELYYSPDVRGPNGEEGGIRVRFPEQARPAIATPNFSAALKRPISATPCCRFRRPSGPDR
jgi:hypothetical protein